MSFGIPVRNGLGIGLRASTALSTRGGASALTVSNVFSTSLYTGNSGTQTITNQIDLAGNGGLVWLKDRTTAYSHYLYDTARGQSLSLSTNTTSPPLNTGVAFQSFNSNGFTLGSASQFNASPDANVSWTFREAPKFFDIVTYTGDGTNGRAISHNLGIAPGCVIIKKTDASQDWAVAHRGNGTTGANAMSLNDAVGSSYTTFPVTSTTFTVSTSGTNGIYNSFGQGMNTNTGTYVAYLFAHNPAADGFIQCGSFTADGSGNVTNQNLGWEPQWILLKASSSSESWILADIMRGWSAVSTKGLIADGNIAEFTNTPILIPTANGFVGQNGQLLPLQTYIYMAIRKAP
jgi:hypothetical protein